MPRPGPRPYECVRRAWHSETHQPIRGSLIQDIFRIVGEIHSPTTKTNKEWQEKLPIVVLKAEEIIYSKANSQEEYMDVRTLGDRVNDAINTIIRRDESSEEAGEFLQPCIEAALHLGCIPRRAPRSQRNCHPRCYLSGNLDLGNNYDATTQGNPSRQTISPLAAPYVNILREESSKFVVPINSCVSNDMPFLVTQKCLPLEQPPSSCFPSNPFSIYPYYGVCPSQPMEPQQMLPLCRDDDDKQMIRREPSPENPPESECDLSLRLGLGSMQTVQDKGENASCQHHQLQQTPMKNTFERGLKDRDVGSLTPINCSSWSYPKGSKVEFSLFSGSSTSRCEEGLDAVEMGRKRKVALDPNNDLHCSSSWQANAAFDQRSNDGKCAWQPNLLPTYSNQRTRTSGL